MRVELRSLDRTLDRVVTAAAQRHASRQSLYVAVTHGDLTGWGEVVPQPELLNGDPGYDEVAEALLALLTRFGERSSHEGAMVEWTRLASWADGSAATRFALQGLESAVVDHALQRRGESADMVWPANFTPLSQATVSLLDDVWPSLGAVARVRVKTTPTSWTGRDRARLASLGRPVLLDFNASGGDVIAVRRQIERVQAACELDAVEQPFRVGDWTTCAALRATLDVAVSVDEGIRTLADLYAMVRYDAGSMICVKPSRVGGVASARTVIERARALGLRAYVGGFFESPLGRRVLHVLAAATTPEPSDLATVDDDGQTSEWVEHSTGWGLSPSEDLLARSVVLFRRDFPL